MQINVTHKFEKVFAYTKDFKSPLTKMQKMMLTELERAKDPRKITKTFLKAIYKKRPKTVYKVNNSFKMKLLNALSLNMYDADSLFPVTEKITVEKVKELIFPVHCDSGEYSLSPLSQ